MKNITKAEKDNEKATKLKSITFNQVVGGSNPPCLTKNYFFQLRFEINKKVRTSRNGSPFTLYLNFSAATGTRKRNCNTFQNVSHKSKPVFLIKASAIQY